MPDPRRDEKALNGLTVYLSKMRTLEQIQKKYHISRRTAYRWLEYLAEQGIEIARVKRNGVMYFFELSC